MEVSVLLPMLILVPLCPLLAGNGSALSSEWVSMLFLLPFLFWNLLFIIKGFPGGARVLKNSSAMQIGLRDMGSIPGSGRSPGGGHGSPLQYSYLENPMGRGGWRATVHGDAQNWTRLKCLSSHARSSLTSFG